VECCEVHWHFSAAGCCPITIWISHLAVNVTALQLEPSLPLVLLSSEQKAIF
jgi:hypothetical protein